MNKNKLFEEELINAVNLEAAPPTEEPERQYYYIAKARKYVKELSEKLGRPLFAHVTTFGCEGNSMVEVELPEKLQGAKNYCVCLELEEEEPIFEAIID